MSYTTVMLARFLWLGLCVAMTIATGASVQAQGDARQASGERLMTQAWSAYEEALFSDALELFNAAQASEGLTLEQLLQIFEGQALVAHATGESGAMEQALRRIANIDPRHTLSDLSPPEVSAALLEARASAGGPIRVQTDAEEIPGGVRVHAEVEGDQMGLVLGFRLRIRASGETEWRTFETQSAELRLPELREVEVIAEAVGPGDAVLAARGTESDPARYTVGDPIVTPDGTGRGRRVALALTGTAVVLGAAAVVLYFVLRPQADTRPQAPRVTGP